MQDDGVQSHRLRIVEQGPELGLLLRGSKARTRRPIGPRHGVERRYPDAPELTEHGWWKVRRLCARKQRCACSQTGEHNRSEQRDTAFVRELHARRITDALTLGQSAALPVVVRATNSPTETGCPRR